jgi:hypothetical protein
MVFQAALRGGALSLQYFKLFKLSVVFLHYLVFWTQSRVRVTVATPTAANVAVAAARDKVLFTVASWGHG